MKGWVLKERENLVKEIAYCIWKDEGIDNDDYNWYNADHIIYFFEAGDYYCMNKKMYGEYLEGYKRWIPLIEKYKTGERSDEEYENESEDMDFST
jgi:hypothetical protein